MLSLLPDKQLFAVTDIEDQQKEFVNSEESHTGSSEGSKRLWLQINQYYLFTGMVLFCIFEVFQDTRYFLWKTSNTSTKALKR